MKFEIGNALTRSDALDTLKEHWQVERRTQEVPVQQACGRVLAQDLHAAYDLPRYRVAALDGIAVRSEDFASGMPDTCSWQLGTDYARADTGDDFPDGYDAVIAIERVQLQDDGSVRIDDGVQPQPGAGVRAAGTYMQEGELLAQAGKCLNPEDIAILAAGGHAVVPVIARPIVAYIPTGNELVDVGTEPGRGQNVQTNSVMLQACFEQWGAEMLAYDIVRDEREALGRAIDDALAKADIVLINGGSSRGSEDFNSELLEERASYFSHGILAAPGRPIGLSIIGGKPAINVPGPMLAAFLSADWLVHGLIWHYLGLAPVRRVTVPAVLETPLKGRAGLEFLTRLHVYEEDGVYHARTVPAGATLAQNVALVNAFFAKPADASYEPGDVIAAELLGTCACSPQYPV